MKKDLPEPDHGNVGISAVCATILEAILSPRANIAFSGGPINAILFLSNSFGSSGFSEACPQPAHTAYKNITSLFIYTFHCGVINTKLLELENE